MFVCIYRWSGVSRSDFGTIEAHSYTHMGVCHTHNTHTYTNAHTDQNAPGVDVVVFHVIAGHHDLHLFKARDGVQDFLLDFHGVGACGFVEACCVCVGFGGVGISF